MELHCSKIVRKDRPSTWCVPNLGWLILAEQLSQSCLFLLEGPGLEATNTWFGNLTKTTSLRQKFLRPPEYLWISLQGSEPLNAAAKVFNTEKNFSSTGPVEIRASYNKEDLKRDHYAWEASTLSLKCSWPGIESRNILSIFFSSRM